MCVPCSSTSSARQPPASAAMSNCLPTTAKRHSQAGSQAVMRRRHTAVDLRLQAEQPHFTLPAVSPLFSQQLENQSKALGPVQRHAELRRLEFVRAYTGGPMHRWRHWVEAWPKAPSRRSGSRTRQTLSSHAPTLQQQAVGVAASCSAAPVACCLHSAVCQQATLH